MGLLILCIMMAAEIGFVIYSCCMKRDKKNWLRNRCIVTGGELAAYLLMILLPGVDFSFRFKGFFIMMIVRLIISLLCLLIKRKKVEGNKKVLGIVMSAICGILVMFVSLVPAFIFTGYEGKETSGQYQVAMSEAILVDESRVETFETDGSKREVPVHFYYPEDAVEGETYPLVIFSHGAFGYYQSNTSTYMELASNGYVVVSLDHPYHSFFTTDTDGKMILVNMKFINDVFYINEDTTPEDEIFEISKKWIDLRSADMNFVVNTLKDNAIEVQNGDRNLQDAWFLGKTDKEDICDVLNLIDCDKIGLMGHSLGGAASVTVGRMRDDIDAVIDLDGTMLGEELGFEDGQYIMYEEPYPVPLLTVSNEEHFFEGKEYGLLYVNNYVLQNAVDASVCYIKGAAHMNYTDLPLFAPALASKLGVGSVDADHCVEVMNEMVLQFMNHYLKDQGELNIQECYE